MDNKITILRHMSRTACDKCFPVLQRAIPTRIHLSKLSIITLFMLLINFRIPTRHVSRRGQSISSCYLVQVDVHKRVHLKYDKNERSKRTLPPFLRKQIKTFDIFPQVYTLIPRWWLYYFAPGPAPGVPTPVRWKWEKWGLEFCPSIKLHHLSVRNWTFMDDTMDPMGSTPPFPRRSPS